MTRSDRVPAADFWTGLPQTAHSALTPLGEIEQATKVAEGFKQTRVGWRRTVFVTGLVILAFAAAFLVFAGIAGAPQTP